MRVFRLAIAVVIGIAINGAVSSQPSNQPDYAIKQTKSDNNANAAYPEKGCGETFWQRTTCDPVALYTLWLAIFTFVLSASTIGLWIETWRGSVKQSRDMRQWIDISERQLTIAQRAYISVRSIFFARMPAVGDLVGLQTSATLENTGNTPTRRAVAHASMRIFNGEIPENFEFTDLDERHPVNIFIAPTKWVGSLNFEITRDELIRCINKKRRIFIWGWIDYDDIFLETARHRTEFCYEVNVINDPSVGNIEQAVSASQYGRYNAADEACYRKPQPYSLPN